MHDPLPSIIIPAYNERSVIGRLLDTLYPGVLTDKFSIVVAVNGSSDGSAQYIAEQFPKITCLDITLGSKTNAINAAEKLGLGFPRLYLDADVRMTLKGVSAMLSQLCKGNEPLLISPKAEMDIAQSSLAVELFYRAWFKTSFYISAGYGGGAYGVNEAGRALFGVFPNVISDDGFVRQVIPATQHRVAADCVSIVSAPATVRDLIKIKTRSKLGNLELKQKDLITPVPDEKPRFTIKPSLPELFVYGIINLIAMKAARVQLKTVNSYVWKKDESSRRLSSTK